MGCGASRLDPNHEGVPPRLRPLLRQRFEEMRARRGHPNYAPAPKPESIDHSPSPKSMRSHDRSSTHHQHNHHHHHHQHDEGALDCPKSQQMEDHGDRHEVKCRPVLPKGNEGNTGRKSEEVNNTERLQVEVEVKGEEDGRMLERDCSPSFRFYCSDSSFDNIPTFSDTEEFEGLTKSEENTRVPSISTNDESVCSNEPSIKSLNRKGKRGRRLKQMIARGGKHKLLHHKSSENPGALQRTVV